MEKKSLGTVTIDSQRLRNFYKIFAQEKTENDIQKKL